MSKINTNKSIEPSNVAVKPKHAGGRPTKYDPKMIQDVAKYIKTVNDNHNGKTIGNERLPTIQGLSLWLGVNDDTLVEWCKKYPEFSASIKELMTKQAQQLLNDGIYSKTNARIVELVLTNNHNMRIRTDTTSAGEKLEGVKIIIVEDKPKIVEGEVLDG